MGRVPAVLVVVLSAFVSTAVPPVEALVGAPAAGRGRRPITVVFVGGEGGTSFPFELSERGHVVTEENCPPDDSGVGWCVKQWYRGRSTAIGRSIGPLGMNDHGAVVGLHQWTGEGFVWDGEMIPQPEIPSGWEARAIDERGRIMINLHLNPGIRVAVRFRGRDIVSPDVLDGAPLTGMRMNDRGEVLAIAADSDGRTFVWRPGEQPVEVRGPDDQILGLYQINDRGTVLGTGASAQGEGHLFLWREGRAVDIGTLGGPNVYLDIASVGQPDRLNEHDQVTGTSDTASGQLHAFFWSDGQMRDLGTLGGANSYGWGINDWGEVVGMSEMADGEYHAFLWRNGAMTDIGVIASPSSTGAYAINNRGQVLGYQRDADRAVLWETRNRG
jgi:probable HAF family extracellular repeat protein